MFFEVLEPRPFLDSAAVPYEPDLAVVRNSIACQLEAAPAGGPQPGSLVTVPANQPRYEWVATAGALGITARGTYQPMDVDTVRDWLLCVPTAQINQVHAWKPGE